MYDSISKKAQKAGQSPGTLQYVGSAKDFSPTASAVLYTPSGVRVVGMQPEADDWRPPRDSDEVLWLRVCGLHDLELIRNVGDAFQLSPVLLEDALNTGQRPKIEEHDEGLFVLLKHLVYDAEQGALAEEQVGLFLGEGYVISLCDAARDPFGGVAERILKGRGRVRSKGADYLLLALIDALVDGCFVTLEALGSDIEELEEDLLTQEVDGELQHIYLLRKLVLNMTRSVRPLREILSTLRRSDLGYVAEENQVFARDIFDHGVQAVDTLEAYRETLAALLELAMTAAGNRMNQIMKVLTIIATLFIPLTFIVGVYGMNFRHMPELGWRWGYFAVWGLMFAVVMGLIIYFKRNRWF